MSEYTINLKSARLPGMTDLNVLVPGPAVNSDAKAFYNSGKKYKVLWMLHGGFGDRNDWVRKTSLGRYAEEREVIVVMPSGLSSDFANHPQFTDRYSFSDFVFEELVPLVHNWFPASDKPEDNIVGGFSMGGAGAWMYGIHRPDLFGGIASFASPLKNYTFLEPHREMSGDEFRSKAMADNKSFPTAYGPPESGIKTKEINMIAKYPSVGAFLDSYEHTWNRLREAVSAGKLPKTYLSYPADDPRSNKEMQAHKDYTDKLGARSITYDAIAGEARGWAFCDSVLTKMMDFFGIK